VVCLGRGAIISFKSEFNIEERPSLLYIKMNVEEVVSALRELIVATQKEKHEPTPSEYLAAIMNSLLQSRGQQEGHMDHLMVVLKGVLPMASRELVRASFRQLAPLLTTALVTYHGSSRIVRRIVGTLGQLLSLQETGEGFWLSESALLSLNTILSLLDDDNESLRKSVGEALGGLMAVHKAADADGVRSYLCDFLTQVFKTCTRSEYKRSLYAAQFLEVHMGQFRGEHAAVLLEALLCLRECRQPVLTAAAYKCMDASIQNPALSLSAEQVGGFLTQLLAAGTDTLDMETNVYFFSGVCSCVVREVDCSEQGLTEEYILSKLGLLMSGFEQEFVQIHIVVGSSIKRMLSHPEVMVTEAVVGRLMSALHTKYQPAWFYVIDVARSLLMHCRDNSVLAGIIVSKLAEVYQSCEDRVVITTPQVEMALTDALAAGVQALRLGAFLKVVPFSDSGGGSSSSGSGGAIGIPERREWILHLLRTALKLYPFTCDEFAREILGRASSWEEALGGRLGARMSPQDRSTSKRNVTQMWSLFPDFCSHAPLDLASHFDTLAPQIMLTMRDTSGQAEVVPYVVTGVTNLANAVKEDAPEQAASVLGPSCTVFLPTLLSIIESQKTSQDGLVQSCVSAIGAWAGLAPQTLITSVGRKLFKVVLSSTATHEATTAGDDAAVSTWMNVIMAILPYLEEAMVLLLYKTLKPILTVSQSTVMQKRGYIILDALLNSYTSVVLQVDDLGAIVRMVADSLYSCHVSSRHTRLRCINTLLKCVAVADVESTVKLVFGEVLICLKDGNKKCRDAAADAMRDMIERCDSPFLLTLVCAGLAAETSVVRSAALMALSLLLVTRRNDQYLLEQVPRMLETCLILVQEQSREQIRAVLGLMRVLVAALPTEDLSGRGIDLATVLPLVLEVVFFDSPHKDRFSARIRGITRKLCTRCGGDAVKEHLPGDDMALVDYILRKERKSARRKQAAGDKDVSRDAWNRVLDSDSEAESSGDDMTAAKSRISRKSRASRRPVAIRASTANEMSSNLPRNLDDLLEDSSAMVGASGAAAKRQLGEGGADNDDDGYRVDVGEDGRLVIESTIDDASLMGDDDDDDVGDTAMGTDKTNSDYGFDVSLSAAQEQRTKGGRKRERVSGEEYKAKKGSGDVWKKGMLAPHAFIPLDARVLKKKSFDKAVGQYGAVLKTKTAKVSAGRGRKGVVMGNRAQRKALAKKLATK